MLSGDIQTALLCRGRVTATLPVSIQLKLAVTVSKTVTGISPWDVPASLALASQTDPVGWFVHDLTMVNEGSGAIFGISEKIGCGLAMANKWTDPPVQIMMSFFIGVPAVLAAMVMVTRPTARLFVRQLAGGGITM